MDKIQRPMQDNDPVGKTERKEYKIGSLRLDNPLILAPMAGVNCAAFRIMCHEHGAGLVSTPMIVAHNLATNPEASLKTISFSKIERPIMAQIVGSKKESMGEAAGILSDYADVIDINMGCPENDILAMQAGSFLVKHPDQIGRIVSSVMSSTNKPVTAKIRIGWDDRSINAPEVAKLLEDLGVSAIAIHGRTRKQKYSGRADWDMIKQVREKANIPIIGNGDIDKPGAARFRLESGVCDMIMIGRAAMGNPFIFSRTLKLLKDGKSPAETTKEERLKAMDRFADLYSRYEKNPKFSELRQHCMWFSQEFNGSKQLRTALMKAKDLNQLKSAIKSAWQEKKTDPNRKDTGFMARKQAYSR